MRAPVKGLVIPLVFTVLGVMGCSPAGPPAEPLSAPSGSTSGELEKPATVAAAQTTERVPEAPEIVGVWLLEDLGGRGVMDMVQTTIEFDGEGRASGSGGCNRFTGSYTFTDGELLIGPLAGTKMMCPEAVMDQEDRFLRALGAVDRLSVDGPFLMIYVGGSDVPLKFTRMDENQNN